MAGMLPGVECARRRRFRFHQTGDQPLPASTTHGWTRRPSFCLYATKQEAYHGSISSMQRSISKQAYEDEKLGGVAREAKERLDERLRMQKKKPETTRHNSTRNARGVDGRSLVMGEFQTEVYGTKRSGSKKFNWAKLSWKAADQDECTICLEQFKGGETLVHLPCAHRFHPRCLVPWLENNAHCPCCRMEIRVELS